MARRVTRWVATPRAMPQAVRHGPPRPEGTPAPAGDRPDAARGAVVRADGHGAEDAVAALLALPGRGVARPVFAAARARVGALVGRMAPAGPRALVAACAARRARRADDGDLHLRVALAALVDDVFDLLRRAVDDHRVV